MNLENLTLDEQQKLEKLQKLQAQIDKQMEYSKLALFILEHLCFPSKYAASTIEVYLKTAENLVRNSNFKNPYLKLLLLENIREYNSKFTL